MQFAKGSETHVCGRMSAQWSDTQLRVGAAGRASWRWYHLTCLRTSHGYSGREGNKGYERPRKQHMKNYRGKREPRFFEIWLEKWIHVRERKKINPERRAGVKLWRAL